MRKKGILNLELYAQVFITLEKYLLQNMDRKHGFCYSTYSYTTRWILTKLGRNNPYMALLNNCSNGSGPLHI